MFKVTCDECGKEFSPVKRKDGLPNGFGFQRKDGSIYKVICLECFTKERTIEKIKKELESESTHES